MEYLILNQYRQGSSYNDVPGEHYHFPARYQNAVASLPIPFIYYEPRNGGEQVYFGVGWISSVYEDTESIGYLYADIVDYRAFAKPVDFFTGPKGISWEVPKTMRHSVRRIDEETYFGLLAAAGLSSVPNERAQTTGVDLLKQELAECQKLSLANPGVVRRIKRVLETYERPSRITNAVKKDRGSKCQLCGEAGFIKRDGKPYCEVHHLFHLSDNPPPDGLSPKYLVVLCATCHRRMHYAKVGKPRQIENGWSVEIDGKDYSFATDE